MGEAILLAVSTGILLAGGAAAVALFAVAWGALRPPGGAAREADPGREGEIEAAAKALGLGYERTAEPFSAEDVAKIELLRRGERRRFRNVVRGARGGREVLGFDLDVSWVAGTSEDGLPRVIEHRVSKSVAAFRAPAGAPLPDFLLFPENHIHRIRESAAASGPEVKIEGDPEFAKAYHTRGPDAAGLKRLLHPGLRTFLTTFAEGSWLAKDRQAHLFHVESAGGWLFVYRAGAKVTGADLARFLDEAAALAGAILEAAGRGAAAAPAVNPG